jgi:hypothetical protein
VVECSCADFAGDENAALVSDGLLPSILQASSRPGRPCRINGGRSEHPDPARVVGQPLTISVCACPRRAVY